MATGSITKRPNGSWRARYRDDGGREHARHFDRKVDGQRWLDEVTAAMVTGMYVDPRAGKVTFGQYAQSWADAQVWRPKTVRRVESDLKLHIMPAFGARPLGAIRPTEVQGFVTRMSGKLAPSTLKTMFAAVRSIFRAAVRDRLIVASPCEGIKLPTGRRREMTVPTIGDVRAMSRALPERYALVPFIGAGLGLRPGEVMGLRVDRINFLGRSVAVQEQLAERTADLVELKTGASYRTVPLPDALAPMIAEHIRVHRVPTDGLLFTTATGLPVRRNTFGKTWAAAGRGIGRPGLRLHDMRHAYASALIDAGESVKVVQERLGHASAMITLDVYGHLWPASDEKTRSAVDAFLTAAADSVRTG